MTLLHYIKNSLKLACLILYLGLTSCGETQVNLDSEDKENKAISPLLNLDPKEKEEIVTNDVFLAVINNKPIEEIDKLLSSAHHSLTAVNKRGDTILGVAIQFKHLDLALSLVEKHQCDNLYHQNTKGESYIYLSSKYGYPQLIHRIAGKCYENDLLDFKDYEFADLDPETKKGEIAIHSALNGSTAEALHYEYTKGTMEYLWFTFYRKNHNGETFLHTAVKDNRINTVEWAVRHYCEKGSWEKSESEWKQTPASILTNSWNWLQSHTFNIDQLINEQDKNDNTALHIASNLLNISQIRMLSNCRWTDFLIENKEGNIALQVFLSALNPTTANHRQEIKEIFIFLVHKETNLKQWLHNISDTVNHQNNQEDSSLHISAGLADPYFYKYLKQFADIYLKNKKGLLPEDIFKQHQNRMKKQ